MGKIANDIKIKFFNYNLKFFRKIVDTKWNGDKINLDWYKKYFLSEENFDKSDIAIFSGMNLKTIHNISGTTTKKIVIDVAKQNYDYLKNLIQQLEGDDDLNIQIKRNKNRYLSPALISVFILSLGIMEA